MSLATDSIFVDAIKSNQDLMEAIGGRLYTTGIPLPDEAASAVPVPYVIVNFSGLDNLDGCKDDEYESEEDNVNIDVLVVAKTREKLADLAKSVRKTVKDYITSKYNDEEDFAIIDYKFSAGKVQLEVRKPCQFQYLRYECRVLNDIEYEWSKR